MANNPKNNDNLKSYQPGQSGNPKGRPKKIYTIIKDMGYTTDDIRGAFKELMFYTLSDLKEIHKDESKPVIVRIIANQLYLALKKGDLSKIKDIMERVLGKEPLPIKTPDVKIDSLGGFYDAYMLGKNGQNGHDEKHKATNGGG
jgi:hypothetical protein